MQIDIFRRGYAGRPVIRELEINSPILAAKIEVSMGSGGYVIRCAEKSRTSEPVPLIVRIGNSGIPEVMSTNGTIVGIPFTLSYAFGIGVGRLPNTSSGWRSSLRSLACC